jgi:hypothetical protein
MQSWGYMLKLPGIESVIIYFLIIGIEKHFTLHSQYLVRGIKVTRKAAIYN